MKLRLTYSLALLMLCLASGNQAVAGFVSTGDLKYGVPGRAYSSASITAAVKSKFNGLIGLPGSNQSAPETQIKPAPDVFIHGSIAPVCEVVLALISVLYLQQTDNFPSVSDPPTRQVLFKVLFRAIIGPNAP